MNTPFLSTDRRAEPVILPASPSSHRPRVLAPDAPPLSSDLLLFLRKGYKALALTTLAGLLGAYVFTGSQTPQYRATATLEIQDLNENFLNLKEVSQVSPFAQASVANDMQTQLRILQSASLVARSLAALPPEKIPPPRGAAVWISRFLSSKAAGEVTESDKADIGVERAASNLQVRETRQARIVDVTYESPDPVYAAAFANSLVQHYIDQSIEGRLEISRGTSRWLEQQLAEVRAKMADSESRLQEYAKKSGLLVTTEEHRPDEEKFRQIQESLSKAQENRMMKQARLETAASAPLDSLDVPLGSALRDYQTKLADLRRQRADLTTVFTTDFDGVKRLDAQIAALESTLRTESNSLLQNIRNEYADSLRRERLLEQSYQDQFGKVTEQAGIAIQFGILKREVDTNRDLYNNILQRTAEAKVASALRASGARIVDPAKKPRLPFRPSRILNLLWGGTGGLLLGLVLATLGAKPHAHLSPARNLAFQLGVPELGSVPRITVIPPTSVEAGLVRLRSQEPVAGANVAMLTWNSRTNPEAGSFRSILTSILLSRQSGHAPQILVITSAQSGEGKTTLVTNLAAALSQMGRQVLLVDAAPDRKLHQLFQQPQDSGLCDVLELPGDNAGLLPYVTRNTSWNGVSLVAIGHPQISALDLFYSPGIEGLMQEMRRNFDVVLMDAPDLAKVPDARILGKMSDGVVLVVRSGDGRLEAARAASERLQDDGTVLLGTVLNQAS
jgi:polysaccharide biosynthesis transport protein